MKITILCTDSHHPVNDFLQLWISELQRDHIVELIRSRTQLSDGDFLFLVSCSEIIQSHHRVHYRHTLVLHASDLPKGRGWSPHVWEIVDGAECITLCLLEAEDQVDTGLIWLKRKIPVPKTALWYEVSKLLFDAEISLMNEAIEQYEKIQPCSQAAEISPTYYRKRTPFDSKVDPYTDIAEQFNLIRMCDPTRYPAWFELHGQRYKLILEKMDHD